jgi:hypothetical protein
MITQETSLHFNFSFSKDRHTALIRVQNYDYILTLIITLTISETSEK